MGYIAAISTETPNGEGKSFYEEVYKKNDTTRTMSWKSLKDSVFACFNIALLTRDLNYTPADPDATVTNIPKTITDVMCALGMSAPFNHPALEVFADPDVFALLAELFGKAEASK